MTSSQPFCWGFKTFGTPSSVGYVLSSALRRIWRLLLECRAQRNCVTSKMNALRSYERRITGLVYPQHVETTIFRNVWNYLANDRAQYPEGLNLLHLRKQYVAVLCSWNLAVWIYTFRNKFHSVLRLHPHWTKVTDNAQFSQTLQ